MTGNCSRSEPNGDALLHLTEPCDLVAAVPLQVTRLRQALGDAAARAQIERWRIVLLGGTAPSAELCDFLATCRSQVVMSYGMTETLTHIALQTITPDHRIDGFRCLPGVSIQLDARGCVIVDAPHVGAQHLVTNDCAELRADGTFKLLGRIDNVINSGGIKVHAENVEAAVTACDPASRRWSPGCRMRNWGNASSCCARARPLMTGQALSGAWQNVYHVTTLPQHYLVMPEFQRSSSGKIQRAATLRRIPTSDDLPHDAP